MSKQLPFRRCPYCGTTNPTTEIHDFSHPGDPDFLCSECGRPLPAPIKPKPND